MEHVGPADQAVMSPSVANYVWSVYVLGIVGSERLARIVTTSHHLAWFVCSFHHFLVYKINPGFIISLVVLLNSPKRSVASAA